MPASTPTPPTAPERAWKLTRPAPQVWQLTLSSPPDNRLTPRVLAELLAHLDTVEGEWRAANTGRPAGVADTGRVGGALIIASGLDKFFSNGLDPGTLTSPDFRTNIFDPFKARLVTFPLVTIAAVHGHAFAGGMLLALCCDYRLVSAGKGLWSMNELLIGVPITGSTSVLLRAKLGPAALRDTITARRFAQADLVRLGIADEVVHPRRLLERAVELGTVEGERAKGGSLGSIKDSVYADVVTASAMRRTSYYPETEDKAFWDRVARERANGRL